jgi:hypothetical protein
VPAGLDCEQSLPHEIPAGLLEIVPEPVPSFVTVSVTVVALVGTRPFPLVAVQTAGLGPGLSAAITPGTVDVVVAGTVPVLSALGADSVSALVDLTGRGPGTYTLEPVVRAAAGTTVQTVQPSRLTVTIRSLSPSPTPVPTGTP